jgi:hypothetical protein
MDNVGRSRRVGPEPDRSVGAGYYESVGNSYAYGQMERQQSFGARLVSIE